VKRPLRAAVVTAVAVNLATVAVLALGACVGPPPATLADGPDAELASLTVAVEDAGAHYRRADWGGWTTVGGCDTRERVLAAQGDGETVDAACRPACPAALRAPCWTSKYDGRPTANPAELDIDHLVPLGEAQQSGARNWTPARRLQFGNDPANLVAVTAAVNRAKGERDPGQWQPAQWKCEYAAGWIRVKATYSLTVDQAERDALAGMLRSCPPPTP
jgi:Protein of unknown function (DUF1524)